MADAIIQVGGETIYVDVGGDLGISIPSTIGHAGEFLVAGVGGDYQWASGTGADAGLRADLADPGDGTDYLGYTPPGFDAEPGSQKDINDRLALFVESFRAGGDTDRQVLAKAFVAWGLRGGDLHAHPGELYDLGNIAPGEIAFTLTGLIGAQREFHFNGASFTINSTSAGGSNPVVIRIVGCENLLFSGAKGTDTGYDAATVQGAKLFEIYSPVSASAEIHFRDMDVTEMIGGVLCYGPGGPRTSGISVTGRFVNVYYPINFQDNGDRSKVCFTAINCPRVHFPYGIIDHEFDIRVFHEGGAVFAGQQAILIKRYRDDPAGIRGKVSFGGVLAYGSSADGGALVAIEAQQNNSTDAAFADTDLAIYFEPSVTNPHNVRGLRLMSYTEDGVANLENSAVFDCATNHVTTPTIITPAVSMARFKVGQRIVGPGIPYPAHIVTVGASTLTLDVAATATAAAAKLNLRTETEYGTIRLRGDFTALTSPIKIEVTSVPIIPAVIVLDPGLDGVQPKHIKAENCRLRTAYDKEFYLVQGDPARVPIRPPLAAFGGAGATMLTATAFVIDDPTLPSTANMGRNKYELAIFDLNAVGGIGIDPEPGLAHFQGSAPTFTFAGNPGTAEKFFSLAVSGGSYAGVTTAMTKLELEWGGMIG